MKILNGKELATLIKTDVRCKVDELNAKGRSVTLAVINVGDDPASHVYVRNKENACHYCGINSQIIRLPKDVEQKDLIALIKCLNSDNSINGILVQLPLPKHIDERSVLKTIAPNKDVDGFHAINMGNLVLGEKTFIPCTAKGIIELLEYNDITIEGKHCVVVGRSNIVGKPVAIELLKRDGTVTICHSKTENLKEICKTADILVCAIGKPKFFNNEYITPGAVVIDVGIHRLEDGSLCGDVDFDDVKDIVSAISPVPNGVGAMTVSMLMKNCIYTVIDNETFNI